MKKIVIQCENFWMDEHEIDSEIFDDVYVEAATRAIEQRKNDEDFKVSIILKCWEKKDFKKPEKHICYNTYFIFINAGLHKKAEILRYNFKKMWNIDIKKEKLSGDEINGNSIKQSDSGSILKTRVIDSLAKEVQELKQKVSSIENKTLVEELKISEEDLREAKVITPVRRPVGRGARPILESEILEAQGHSKFAIEAARYLGVSYDCYKKWRRFYGLHKTNQWGHHGDGKRKFHNPETGKYPLNKLIQGLFPEYPIWRLKDLLIRSQVKKAMCENCEFMERRITDGKMPLLLNFKDGNERNHVLENIEVLCYNCMFLMGRGYIRKGKVEFNFLDSDKLQGAPQAIDARF